MAYADPVKERAYQRAYQRQWVKARVERWRAAGGCTRCGKPVQKFTRCAECRAYLSDYHQRKQRKKRMTKRCPNHPRNWMSASAKQCRVCQQRAAVARKKAKNRTIGPLAALLITGTFQMRELVAALGCSDNAVLRALKRLKEEGAGLVEERLGRVPVYRLEPRQEQVA